MGSYACWSRSLDRVAVTCASRHLLEMSGHCLNNEGLPCPGLAINLEEELWGWGRVVLFGGNGSLEVVYNEVVYLALFEIQGVHHSL